MTRLPRQLALELPHRSAVGAEDFLVSAANRAAVELIDRWPDWPNRAALVVGPAGSGKSHLAQVWRLNSGSHVISAHDVDEKSVALLETKNGLVIEDLGLGIGNERILFHLLNLTRQEEFYILFTSSLAPGGIDVDLPDLRSRLRALPIAIIEEPDDLLLKAVLIKLFEDRQLNVEPAVVDYIALRMERSMDAANRVVKQIDQLALEKQRRVTRHLAGLALDNLGQTDQDV